MKLTPEQREALAKKKRNGTAYSDLMIYGSINLGTARVSPKHSKVARVELNAASDAPAALAKILETYAAKPSVPGPLLEVICAVIADGFIGLAKAGAPDKAKPRR